MSSNSSSDNGATNTLKDDDFLTEDDMLGGDAALADELLFQSESDEVVQPVKEPEEEVVKQAEEVKVQTSTANEKVKKSIPLWGKIALWTAGSLVGLYVLGMAIEPETQRPNTDSPAAVKTEDVASPVSNANTNATQAESVLASFDNDRLEQGSLQSEKVAVANGAGESESIDTSILNKKTSDASIQSSEIQKEIDDLNKRLDVFEQTIAKLTTQIAEQSQAASSLSTEELEQIILQMAQSQKEHNANLSDRIDELASTIATKKLKKPAVSYRKPPKLRLAMSVEGSGVFITEKGKEITLTKGDYLKGFGPVIYVDVGGCIFGENNTTLESDEATCPN